MSRFSQPRSSYAQFGQPQAGQPDGFFVVTFPMSASTLFDWHVHEDHQLAWASAGVLTVLTEGATWVLPPTRALWIPAGLPHETGASSRATMRSVYVPPALSPVDWTAPTVVTASPLLAEVIRYLGGELTAERRVHAEALLSDLLTPIPVKVLDAPLPADPLVGQVARALRDNPADQRTLADWGRTVGASERTLARAFVAGAGVPFGHWRTRLRVQAALPLLAGGEPVSRVARRVGYETPSAFVAAFRRETGITPAAYFAITRTTRERPAATPDDAIPGSSSPAPAPAAPHLTPPGGKPGTRHQRQTRPASRAIRHGNLAHDRIRALMTPNLPGCD